MVEDFLSHLMNNLLESTQVPKVQVERFVGPILLLFLPELLTEYYKNNSDFSGKYILISEEFPLSKYRTSSSNSNSKSYQSTNIDYILLNREKNFLIFLELKTEVNWKRDKQLETYLKYKKLIEQKSAIILIEDLLKIKKKSRRKDKYEFLVKRILPYCGYFEHIKNVKIIYLVPNNSLNDKIDDVIHFDRLPSKINHNYSDEWSIINNYLSKLSELETNSHLLNKSTSLIDKEFIYCKVYSYIRANNPNSHPITIAFGILGKGPNPNYQIEFSDGAVVAFYSSGRPHPVGKFKTTNLTLPIKWTEFQKMDSDYDASQIK